MPADWRVLFQACQMPTETDEIRVTDSKARLTLPKAFANSTLLITVVSDVEIVIRRAKVIPLDPGGELPPDPSPAPLSTTDWNLFLSLLDSPPAIPDDFKAAIADQKKKLQKPKAR